MKARHVSLCVAAVAMSVTAADIPAPKPSLDGTWVYNSFTVHPEDLGKHDGKPLKPWSPTGELTVKTGMDGKFEGKLTFMKPDTNEAIQVPGKDGMKPLALDVKGEITTAEGKTPAGFTAQGTITLLVPERDKNGVVVKGGDGKPVMVEVTFDNRLKGWFVPDPQGTTVVRGSIMNAGPDFPATNQPPYTVGTFVLRPKAAGGAGG